MKKFTMIIVYITETKMPFHVPWLSFLLPWEVDELVFIETQTLYNYGKDQETM